MTKTYVDAAAWTASESWRAIRNHRASPLAALQTVLSREDRADTFHTAFEQAEELFRAAAAVSAETRPILLFYGLSQAGRALTAASPQLERSDWQSSGHGLHCDPSRSSEIWKIETAVDPGPRGLFARVSAALGSPRDLGAVQLGATVSNLLEIATEYPEKLDYPQILNAPRVYVRAMPVLDDGGPLKLPLAVGPGEDPEGAVRTTPALSNLTLSVGITGLPQRDHNDHVLLLVPEDSIVRDGDYVTIPGVQRYRGREVLVRQIGTSSHAVNPLLMWWLTLFPLSMLARYEPRKWRRFLDLRRHEGASQVEYLCDRALDAVPQLLAEAIELIGETAKVSE